MDEQSVSRRETLDKKATWRRAWNKANPDKVKATRDRSYAKNKDKINARSRAWHKLARAAGSLKKRTPEKNRKYNQTYRAKHAEKCRQRDSDYYWENRDKILKYHALDSSKERARNYRKTRYHSDTSWKVRQVLTSRITYALRHTGLKYRKGSMAFLGCSIGRFMEYIASHFKPGMSWANYGLWHLDHKRPCASFNLTDQEQQSQCFSWLNFQPLWATENISKGAKYNL